MSRLCSAAYYHDTNDYSIYPFPSRSVTQLAWKPSRRETEGGNIEHELAVASEDSSLRIYSLKLDLDN